MTTAELTDFGGRMVTNKIITVAIITVLVILIIAVIVSKFR
jgi:vesicle transport through interaction with t-SNAREs protein 1